MKTKLVKNPVKKNISVNIVNLSLTETKVLELLKAKTIRIVRF